jgi:hypothetical protein
LQGSERRRYGQTDGCSDQRGGDMVKLMVAVIREDEIWSNWWLQCEERRRYGQTDGCSAQRGRDMVNLMVAVLREGD